MEIKKVTIPHYKLHTQFEYHNPCLETINDYIKPLTELAVALTMGATSIVLYRLGGLSMEDQWLPLGSGAAAFTFTCKSLISFWKRTVERKIEQKNSFMKRNSLHLIAPLQFLYDLGKQRKYAQYLEAVKKAKAQNISSMRSQARQPLASDYRALCANYEEDFSERKKGR